MSRVGFEPTILMFERLQVYRALDCDRRQVTQLIKCFSCLIYHQNFWSRLYFNFISIYYIKKIQQR
jgi:hypothetical protein